MVTGFVLGEILAELDEGRTVEILANVRIM
jgi:hypothetical protein